MRGGKNPNWRRLDELRASMRRGSEEDQFDRSHLNQGESECLYSEDLRR